MFRRSRGRVPQVQQPVLVEMARVVSVEDNADIGDSFVLTDLNSVVNKLKSIGYKGQIGIAALGGAGANLLANLATMDPEHYLNVHIIHADLDVAGMIVAFESADEKARSGLEKWMAKKAITILPIGGEKSDGCGAGAEREYAEKMARMAKTKKAITAWIQKIDILIVVFAAGGGTGAGSSVVFLEIANALLKQVIAVVIMPNRKEGRYARALDVLSRTEKLAPTLVRQNAPLTTWLAGDLTVSAEVRSRITRGQGWYRMNEAELLPVMEMLLDITAHTGETQNVDAKNLQRFLEREKDDESRHLFFSMRKLTEAEMKNPYNVGPEVVLNDMFRDPLGVSGVLRSVRKIIFQTKGPWSLIQSEGMLDGVRAQILADDPDAEVMIYPGATEQIKEGEPWSVCILAIARDLPPGRMTTLEVPAPMMEIKPVQENAVLGRSTSRPALPAGKDSNSGESNSKENKLTALLSGTCNGRPKTVSVPDTLASEHKEALRNHEPREKIEALHDRIAAATVDDKHPEGVRFDLPKYLTAPAPEAPQKKSAFSGLIAAFSPPRVN